MRIALAYAMQLPMLMNTKRMIKKMFNATLDSLPSVGLRRRNPPIMSWVLGAVGLAFVGGVAVAMIASPRLRTRALRVAKDTYGKVSSGETFANGLAQGHEQHAYAPTESQL